MISEKFAKKYRAKLTKVRAGLKDLNNEEQLAYAQEAQNWYSDDKNEGKIFEKEGYSIIICKITGAKSFDTNGKLGVRANGEFTWFNQVIEKLEDKFIGIFIECSNNENQKDALSAFNTPNNWLIIGKLKINYKLGDEYLDEYEVGSMVNFTLNYKYGSVF